MDCLLVTLSFGVSCQLWGRYQPCCMSCRSCVMEVILVVFGSARRVLGIPEDSILGIVFTRSGLEALAVEQVVMFLREVSARAGPPIAL